MKLTQIITILKARRWLVLGTLLVIVGLVVGLSLMLPERYVASASVVIDTKATDPVTGALLPLEFLPGYMATQVDVIASHNVALKVVDKLQLTRLPELREQFQSETNGAGSLRDWIADILLDHLDVRPSRESSVIEIRYPSPDPRAAAALANAFADAYIQTSLELKVDPARRQAGWFEGQSSELRGALEGAQRRLAEYQRENGIVDPQEDRLDVENGRLAELSTELVTAQRTMYDADTRQHQLDDAVAHDRVDELPDIVGNPVLQSMKADLVRSEAKLAEISGRYDVNHPQYLSAAAEADALKNKFLHELGTAKGSIVQSAQIARRQVAEVQQALDRQKQHVLGLSHQREKLAVLTRDVESAKAAYDGALQRTTNVRLESRLNQTEIAILNPAIPPLLPVFPKLTLNAAISVVLGSMLGIGLALVLEALNRRVRSEDDLSQLAGVTVLADLGRLPRTRQRATSPTRARRAGGLLRRHRA
jgi:chain length determinant protein EpsF